MVDRYDLMLTNGEKVSMRLFSIQCYCREPTPEENLQVVATEGGALKGTFLLFLGMLNNRLI